MSKSNYIIRYGLISAALLLAIMTILFAMGRPPICECGSIKLWHGVVQSAENSQHISDWYTFSHIIHGFLFYGAGYLIFRKYPAATRTGLALLLAIVVEGAWEILENSPVIINRYREATIAFGYEGDSILNSMADIAWMIAGFFMARKLPVFVTIVIAVLFELLALYMIRDNLTLNVLMLVSPIEAVKDWQSAV